MPYFVAVCALFVVFWLARMLRRQPARRRGLAAVDSLYPLLLCLLMACCATLYESMQVFVPDTWEHFYYNPTLSPLHVPGVLSLFLLSFWLFIIVLVATVDVLFRRLPFVQALYALLGLSAACICCYFFFILTTWAMPSCWPSSSGSSAASSARSTPRATVAATAAKCWRGKASAPTAAR